MLAHNKQHEWQVVALPFLKFFNADDPRAGAEFDWSKPVDFSEKLDGMMVTLYHFADEWHVATMGVPDGSNCVQGGESVHDLVLNTLTREKLNRLPHTVCFMFELLSPKAAGLELISSCSFLISFSNSCH